jgi:hypothetical protein
MIMGNIYTALPTDKDKTDIILAVSTQPEFRSVLNIVNNVENNRPPGVHTDALADRPASTMWTKTWRSDIQQGHGCQQSQVKLAQELTNSSREALER